MLAQAAPLLALPAALLALASPIAWAEAPPAASVADASAVLPGVAVDLDARTVAIEATVIGQDAEWLELIACVPRSREHEALVVTDARPSHLHLALTMIGLEPGSPRTAERLGPGEWQVLPARGPAVRIDVTSPGPDGPTTTPIDAWYTAAPLDDPTEATLQAAPPDTFLFTGSQTRTHEGTTHYLADLSGSVISLVHFGDDTVARLTSLTQDTDGQALRPTAAVPPNGTAVTLTLRPADGPAVD
ncbi:MAG: YdjY domain-containing protein [Planctomycetota bacterium]